MSHLTHKRIVITRASHQADALVNLVQEYDAIPILYPCITLLPPDNTQTLDTCLHQIHDYDWLILTSSNTVYALHQRLQTLDIQPTWGTCQIACVGKSTASALNDYLHRPTDFITQTATGQALADSLPLTNGAKIFLPQSGLADHSVANMLISRGAQVTVVDAYQTVIGAGGDDVPAMLQRGEIDVLTFTSSSTVDNFLQRITPLPLPDLPALCIGSSTAQTAREAGFQQVIIPEQFNLEGMMSALHAYYASIHT